MKLSRALIGRKGRPTCDRLRSDAATVDAVLNGMAVVVMRGQEREIQTASQSRCGNHEFPLVRPGRIHRRSADRSCVFTSAIGETPELVAEIFTAERRRSTADNRFAHLRFQFVSVYHGGVLVFDQLVRFMAFTQYQKTFETWPAMATMNLRETTRRGRRQGSRLFDVGLPGSYSQSRDGSPKTAPIARSGQISR